MLTTLVSVGGYSQPNEYAKPEVGIVEVVTFKIKEGISYEDAKQKLLSLNECVEAFDGFIERRLSVNENDEWLDMVFWTNKEAALKAAELVMSNPKAMEVFAIMDETSLKINHYNTITLNN